MVGASGIHAITDNFIAFPAGRATKSDTRVPANISPLPTSGSRRNSPTSSPFSDNGPSLVAPDNDAIAIHPGNKSGTPVVVPSSVTSCGSPSPDKRTHLVITFPPVDPLGVSSSRYAKIIPPSSDASTSKASA
jgi:hypothetical protein